MKKLILFTVLISAVTLGGFWSGKKFCAMMPFPGASRPAQNLYSSLSLDPNQRESIQKLEDLFRKDADALCMEVCEKRMTLLENIKNKNTAPAIIDAEVDEIGRLQIVLEKKVIAHILAINQNLTSPQSQAYLESIYHQQCQMVAQSGIGDTLDNK